MASTLIGALRVTLGLDSAAFEKGADRSIKKLDAVGRAGFATGRTLKSLAGIASAAGLGLAGVFSARAVHDALEYAGSLGEVAAQLGVTTKELQVYRFAAGQVGITQEQMDKSLAKLSLTIGKAAAGAKAETRTFETLGISIRDAGGNVRSTGAVLLDVAEKLQAIKSPAERSAVAFALFGRAGQKLLPLLEGGADGLKEFAKQAEAAGLVIAEGDIAKADETADKIDALTTALKINFSREVAQNADSIFALASALSTLIGWLIKAGAAYINFWRGVGSFAGRVIQNPMALFGQDRPRRPGGAQPPAGNSPPAPTVPTANLAGLFGGGGGGGGRHGRSAADETAKIRENLQDIRGEIEDAFDTRNLPESVEEAEKLREKLAEIAEDARKAGVPMSQFSGEVAGLTARIKELETKGLADEAEEFSKAVFEMGRTVDEADSTAMTPLSRRLADINARFESLKEKVQEQIDENAALAEVNERAARSMADLRDMLGQLEAAHAGATDAALAQFQAEQELRDLAAGQAAQDIGQSITDLHQARGDSGFFSNNQLELQQTEQQLQEERLASLIQLRSLEADRAKAQLEGDQAEVVRLNGIIALQSEYHDLVAQTTAEQIVSTQRLQDAFADFTAGISDALFDMATQFDFSLKSFGQVFLKLLNDTLLRPATDSLANSASGFLQGLLKGVFAGGFATGGTIPRGQWGIVGENGPEPVFAGDRALSVVPNDALGGGQAVFNITVPGAMNDRDARRTGNQIGAAAARRQAQARKAGLAG